MDTSGESTGQIQPYVSCIVIDGSPILPPVMTEGRRNEMRRYREMAKAVEKRLKSKKNQVVTATAPAEVPSVTTNSIQNPSQMEPESVASCSENEPSSEFDGHFVIRPNSSLLNNDMNSSISSKYEDAVCSMETGAAGDSSRTLNKSPSPENSESSGSGSDGNFASAAASSTGTFIIKSNTKSGSGEGSPSSKSEGEIVSDDFESESDTESKEKEKDKEEEVKSKIPVSVLVQGIRGSIGIGDFSLVKTRKRPAAYFDSDENDGTESEEELSEAADMADGNIKSKSKVSPSPPVVIPVPVPVLTPTSAIAVATSPNQNQTPRYDISLSKEIPSSAEKSTLGSSDITPEKNKNQSGNESDKENQNDGDGDPRRGKHVRKLSYTLSEPSAALLAVAAASGTVTTTTDLDPDPGDSSTIPSFPATPYKKTNYFEDEDQGQGEGLEPPTPSNQELDNRLDALNRHLAQLQVGLGLNKKEHLERYLGEVALVQNQKLNTDEGGQGQSQSQIVDSEIDFRFKKLQQTHEQQMAALMEMHAAQQAKLKEDFERQRTLLMGEIQALVKSSTNTPSRGNNETPYSPRTQYLKLDEKNNVEAEAVVEHDEPISIKTKKKSSVARALEFGLGDVPSSPSTATATASISRPSTAAITTVRTDNDDISSLSEAPTITNSIYGGGRAESLGSVRLSKLQSKMQSMNQSLFKGPSDSRSPLLKGLTFPDPLDRPRMPLRIPNRALDPSMKPKFDRVSATVKGYLIRRLLRTEKVQIIIQTIRDTVELLLKLYDEAPDGKTAGVHIRIKPEDLDLHRRSLQQLTGACTSFHDVFFKLSTQERMAIIAGDREKIRAKALKNEMIRNHPNSPTKRNVSTATLKSMERRMSLSTQPQSARSLNRPLTGRRPATAKSHRQSLRDKVSPKRRRMSHFVAPAPIPVCNKNKNKKNLNPTRETTAATTTATATAKKWRVSEQIRGSQLNATYVRGSGPSLSLDPSLIVTNFNGGSGGSSSAIVFSTTTHSSTFVRTSSSTAAYSHNNSNNSTNSTSSRFSIGLGHSETTTNTRSSIARPGGGRRSVRPTPWK